MSKFKREPRYMVMKLSDVREVLTSVELSMLDQLRDKVDQHRKSVGKRSLKCLVVEDDWPEYEDTWKRIQYRSSK